MVVVFLDPGRDPGPGRRLGRVVLDAPQLELQGRVPRLDDRVVPALALAAARQRPFPRPVVARRFFLRLAARPVLAHDRRDPVLADLPLGLTQVSGDPRRPVGAPVGTEQPPISRPAPDAALPAASADRPCACNTRTWTRPGPGRPPHAGSGAVLSGRRSAQPPLAHPEALASLRSSPPQAAALPRGYRHRLRLPPGGLARAGRENASGHGVIAGSSASPGDGTRRASAILARAQRRDVRPNIWASLRSESGLPAWALSRYAATAASLTVSASSTAWSRFPLAGMVGGRAT